MERDSLVVIFDCGSLTLKTSNYCHMYYDPRYRGLEYEDAAEAVAAILAGESTQYWDGNEPEHRLDPEDPLEEAETRYTLSAILAIKSKPYNAADFSSHAEKVFFRALLS